MVFLKKVTIVFLFVVVCGTTIIPQRTHAAAWGEAMAAMLTQQTLETMKSQVIAASRRAAKVAATQTINESIQRLITGRSREPRIITDPYDYIFLEPQRRAGNYMNDFFSVTAQGRDSRGNYTNQFSAGDNSGLSYEGELVAGARGALGYNNSRSRANIDLRNFCPTDNPKNVFGDGNWACYSALTSNPYNNPYGYTIAAQQAARQEEARQSQVNYLEALSGRGIKNATDEQGNILTPGSFIWEISAAGFTLPITAIAETDPDDTGALTTLLTKSVVAGMTQIVEQGIGLVREKAQREINDTIDNVREPINGKINVNGPGIVFDPYDLYGSSGGQGGN